MRIEKARSASPPKSAAQKMAVYRQRMKAQGLRQVTLWVPDVHSPMVQAEVQRQCRLVANSPHEEELSRFIESVADYSDWTE